jgi:hypothetical protein
MIFFPRRAARGSPYLYFFLVGALFFPGRISNLIFFLAALRAARYISLFFSRRSSFFSWPQIRSIFFPRRAARGSPSLSFFYRRSSFFFLWPQIKSIFFLAALRAARHLSLFFLAGALFFLAADPLFFPQIHLFFLRRAARGSPAYLFFFSHSGSFFSQWLFFSLSVALFSHTNMYHIIYSLSIP